MRKFRVGGWWSKHWLWDVAIAWTSEKKVEKSLRREQWNPYRSKAGRAEAGRLAWRLMVGRKYHSDKPRKHRCDAFGHEIILLRHTIIPPKLGIYHCVRKYFIFRFYFDWRVASRELWLKMYSGDDVWARGRAWEEREGTRSPMDIAGGPSAMPCLAPPPLSPLFSLNVWSAGHASKFYGLFFSYVAYLCLHPTHRCRVMLNYFLVTYYFLFCTCTL